MSNLFGQSPGRQAATTQTEAMGINLQGAQYGSPVPVVYGQNLVAGNVIDYWGFSAQSQSQKVGKGGGGATTKSYTYKTSYLNGICEGPISSIVNVWEGTSQVILSTLAPFEATGTMGQAAWSALPSGHQLGYSLTALFGVENMDLGGSPSIPNYNYEVKALLPFSASVSDAEPSTILTDICTSEYHGIKFPYLGDLTQYHDYCVANSLFLSPAYQQQQTGVQTLTDLFTNTNAYAYFSEGVLKVVPLGDVAVTGNGVTYTPDVTPLYDLGYHDFICDAGKAPVQITRKAPTDCLNVQWVQFVDRSQHYINSEVVASIDDDVVRFGARANSSVNVNGCTSAAVARFIAQNMVQRAFYVRNTYRFKLPFRYCLLEPADIVTLTDPACGLDKFPVRLTQIEEDGTGLLTVDAEEFPEGIGHSAIYATQENQGATIDQNADPEAVNAPALFRGPGFLTSPGQPEIWCAVCGSGALWAGAQVYISHDGDSYTYVGAINAPARYGTTTTVLPSSGADPDTANTLGVDLYAPAELDGGSQADADNLNTLALVGSELIAYETATLTGTDAYNLTYLRRGCYGSQQAASLPAGAMFVRLDDAIYRIPVDASLIGQTVYLKFLSLNVFGRTPRTLAEETAYTYVVGTNVELPDVPDVPASFAVQGVADGVSVTWTNDNPAAVGCTSIERATASGGPWTVLAQVGPTTTAYHDSFTNGATYYYRARARGPLPQSGWSAYTDTFSSTGVDVSAISATANSANENAELALTKLGNLDNSQYVRNPFFSTGDLTGWEADTTTPAWVFQSGSTNNPASASTTYAIITGNGTSTSSALRNLGMIPVYPGAVIKAQCLVRASGADGRANVRISWRNGADAEISVTDGTSFSGTSTNGSYVTATAPASAVYAHIEAAAYTLTTGSYSVDNFAAWALADTLDQVPDSSTRFAAVTASADNTANAVQPSTWLTDSANMARGGDSITRFGGRTLDNVGDSASRFAAAQAGADKTGSNTAADTAHVNGVASSSISPIATLMPSQAGANVAQQWATSGENLVVNGGFESNTAGAVSGANIIGSAAPLCDGWTLLGDSGSASSQCYWYSGAAYNSGHGLFLRAPQGFSVPANSPLGAYYVRTWSQQVNVNYGDVISFGGDITTNSSGPSISLAGRIGLYWIWSDGSETEWTGVGDASMDTPWHSIQGTVAVPAPTTNGAGAGIQVEFARIECAMFYGNSSGAAIVVPDGNTYAQFDNIWMTRNDVRVPGSGQQLGDGRNLNPVYGGNLGSAWNGLNLSYSPSTGSNIIVTASAATLVMGDAPTPYSAGSLTVSVGSTGVTNRVLWLYYVDPTYSGGAHQLQAQWDDPSVNVAASNQNILLGPLKITYTPGSGTNPGTGSGGGVVYCVAHGERVRVRRWLIPRWVLAQNVRFGDCVKLAGRRGWARVTHSFAAANEVCRVECENDESLTCSVNASLLGASGEPVRADASNGAVLWTIRGASRVRNVEVIGERVVQKISAGGVYFVAGGLGHHNIKVAT